MTQKAPQYQVTTMLIQLSSRCHGNQAVNRHLTTGDIVPEWVTPDELDHLLKSKCIEKVAA